MKAGEIWLSKPCRYWDAAKNRRYRFFRVDQITEYGGIVGQVWDGEERRWLSSKPLPNWHGARLATPQEIATIQPTLL